MPSRLRPAPRRPPSLVDILRARADGEPDTPVFTFLVDGERDEAVLTYGELDRRARAVAARLAGEDAAGQRVLLLLPPGLDYIVAFYATLYAGATAVPAYPPRPGRSARSLDAIVADATARLALRRAPTRAGDDALDGLAWLDPAAIPSDLADDWRPPVGRPSDPALIQYTSGSTARPRGAVVTARQLVGISEAVRAAIAPTADDRGVFWLPPYHDLGLFASIIQPVFAGGPVTLMSPLAFLQRPMRWLEAVSRTGATITGAPNFAYDLAVEQSRPEDRAALDLSRWRYAMNGAEPVRPETMERFAAAFEPAGFRRSAFAIAYGLAEILPVSMTSMSHEALTIHVDRDALAAHRAVPVAADAPSARAIVSCGLPVPGVRVAVVDPESRRRLPDGEVGEIWASGDNVVTRYWRRPSDSRTVLRARIDGEDEGRWMRTGDLGFLRQGEVFVTGRRKEMLIIRGRNYYPLDLERTVEESHPDVRRSGVAAVSLLAGGVERLALVAEVDRRTRADPDEILGAIRRAITEEHDLRAARIALIIEGRLPRTSSGKIQRHAVATALRAGELKTIADWTDAGIGNPSGEQDERQGQVASSRPGGPSAREIEAWLVAHLAETLKLTPDSIDREAPFATFGLGSVEATALAGELATHLDRPLSPTLTWEHPTIERLARHLAEGPTEAPDEFVAAPQEPIAIVGIGLKLPGANSMEEFRDLLRNGRDAIRRAPADRWDAEEFWDPTPATPGKMVTTNGGFVDGVDLFDPQFFGISPREASRMDPQQRMILEVTEDALENAAIPPAALAGTATGVFIGIGAFEYSLGPAMTGDRTLIDAYSGTGNAHSIAANRISFLYDLRGPSVALDTACSSSLVAIHLACQSLLSHESDTALAGAVNLIVAPTFSIAASQARMLSPDGLCKSFDASADGYVRSEGAAVVVLKRLSDARRDGDRIMGLIRGTAVNQDGLTSGITAPNGRAQQEVVRTALARAGIRAADLGAIEAHGTGTALGDPIEVNALAEVVGPASDGERIWMGSVKANVGHLEVASAMASLAKVILELQHGEIYPQIHFDELNPRIRIEGTPLTIPTAVEPWPMELKPRYVGISSFGFGGTNAHIVVEEAREPIVPRSHVERPVHIASLSAKSEGALRQLARRTAEHLELIRHEPSAPLLEDVAHTLNVGRPRHVIRAAVVAASLEELGLRLGALAEGKAAVGVSTGRRATHPPSVAFMFTGQGAQYAGMGRTLYETQPTFRAALDRVAALLDRELDRPLLSLLHPAEGEPDLLAETIYTQPALFALEYALAELWRSWGVTPDVVLGHSVGEYVAAVVAGALSLEDAARLIAARGRLMHGLPRENGAMAAVLAPLDVVQAAVEGVDGVDIAGVNTSENITISGLREQVEGVSAALAARDIRVVPLNVSHAFHSPLMEPILDEFEQLASGVEHRPLEIALAANLSGQLLAPGARLDARYWRDHARRAVRFADDVRAAHEFGAQIFVEIGPSPTLTGMGRRTLAGASVSWAASLKPDEDAWRTLLGGLGVVFAAGRDIDWAAFDRDYRRQRVALPGYPFERTRYWFEGEAGGRGSVAATVDRGHPMTRTVAASAYPTVQTRLSPDAPAFLADHQVQGSVVVPGTLFVELMLDAAAGTAGPDVPVPALDNVEFAKAMFMPPGSQEVVQAIVSPDGTGGRSVHVLSRREGDEGDWTLRASASVAGTVTGESPRADPAEIEAARARCTTEIVPAEFYHYIGKLGLVYLGAFQGIRELARRHGEAVALIEAPESIVGDLDRYHVHPALLDAIAQVFAVAGPGSGIEDAKGLYLPVGLGRLRARRPLPARFWAHVTLNDDVVAGSPTMAGTLRALDEEGNLILQVDDWRVQMIDADARLVADEPLGDWLYRVDWRSADSRETPQAIAARSWVVLADGRGLGERLAAELREQGHRVQVVPHAAVAAGDGTATPGASRDVVDAVWKAALAAGGGPPDGVVCLWPLDAAGLSHRPSFALSTAAGSISAVNGHPRAGRATGRNGRGSTNGRSNRKSPAADARGVATDEVSSSALSVAHLVQAMSAAAPEVRSRLVLVTRGASAGFPGGDETSLLQAAVTGLVRVVRMEHPQLEPLLLDLGPEPDGADAARLAAVLADPPAEPEMALRDGEWLVRRLQRIESEESEAESSTGGTLAVPPGPYRLESTQPGMLDRLALRPASRRAPGPGEVEVQVQAAGVNFRDVMKALGIYPMQPGDVPWLGDEFAGRVLAAGDGVDLEVGQEVFGVAPAAFGSAISTRADYVLPKPASISAEDAATLPVVFTTALYALTRLARLQPGERVLIHAAAGGVGQAAIQIAQAIGAEIHATASEGKRDFVRSMGVDHVYDSRSLAFADQVREATGGRGVDVVLNHLAGDFIPASISVLAPYGRFVEIGKRDIFANSKIGLWPFRNNLSFFAVDMDRLGRDRPAIYRDLLREVFAGFEAGTYRPLPRTVFPIQAAGSAFRYLAQARNIGKVVLAFDAQSPTAEEAAEGFSFRGDSSYLITGGLRGLGARVAEWMAMMGARHLVLVGRDPASEAARDTAARVAAAGGRATMVATDVGDPEQVAALIGQIDASLPPLRGIVHGAGVLADGILQNLDDDRFRSVFGPKAAGALNLHRATAGHELDFFISFSSTSSLMGNPGQANYAAANAFLDRLAWLRRSQGRSAQTIHWGPWSEIGMSATAEGQRSFEFGVGTISPARGIEALGRVTRDDLPEVAVMPMDWARFISRLPTARTDPFLAVIRESVQLEADAAGASAAMREALLAAPPEGRTELVEEFVRAELAKVLELDPDALPLDQPLNTVGLDSLMALELKNRVEVGLGISLPIVSLIQGPTISQLAVEIVGRLDAPADEPETLDIPLPSGRASAGAAAADTGASAATGGGQ